LHFKVGYCGSAFRQCDKFYLVDLMLLALYVISLPILD